MTWYKSGKVGEKIKFNAHKWLNSVSFAHGEALFNTVKARNEGFKIIYNVCVVYKQSYKDMYVKLIRYLKNLRHSFKNFGR